MHEPELEKWQGREIFPTDTALAASSTRLLYFFFFLSFPFFFFFLLFFSLTLSLYSQGDY